MNSNPIEKFLINCNNIDATKKQRLANSCNQYTIAVNELNKLVNVFKKRYITLQKYNYYVKRTTLPDDINNVLTKINNLKSAFLLSEDLNSLNNIMDCIIFSYKIKYIKEFNSENKESLITIYNFKIRDIKELYEINEDFTEIQALDDALKLFILTVGKNKLFNIYKIPNPYTIDDLTVIKSLIQSNYNKNEIDKNTLKNDYNASIDKIPELLPLHDYFGISDIIRAILYCQKLYNNSLKPDEIYKYIAYNERINFINYKIKITNLHDTLLRYCRELIGKSAIKPLGFYSNSANIPAVPRLPANLTDNDRALKCIGNTYSRVTLVAELNRLYPLIIFQQSDDNLLNRMTLIKQRLVNKNNYYHAMYFIVDPELNESAFNYWNNVLYRVNQYIIEIAKLYSYDPAIKKTSDTNFSLFIGTLKDYVNFFNNLYDTIIQYNQEPDKIQFDKLIDEYDILYDDYMNKLNEYNKCY